MFVISTLAGWKIKGSEALAIKSEALPKKNKTDKYNCCGAQNKYACVTYL